MPKITKRILDAALSAHKVSPDGFIWDSELRGYGVRIRSSGSSSFVIQYRTKTGQQRRMAIGRVGTLTPDEARSHARQCLASVAKGEDPSSERAKERKSIKVCEVCDWYIAQSSAGRLLGRNGRPVKPSTLAMDRSRIETHVKPLIGNKAVRDLKRNDLEKMQSDIAAGKTAKPRKAGRAGLTKGGAAVAARTLGMLSTIFEKARRADLISMNPADGCRKIAGRRRYRRLTLADVATLGLAMNRAASKGTSITGLRAICGLLLTGFRKMELLALRPNWIGSNSHGAYVIFPDTKSDTQVRPIGAAAFKLFGNRSDQKWIFPGDHGDGHFVGVARILKTVSGDAGLKGVTPHVLRHTFASVAGDLGFTKLVIKALLGHTSSDVTEGYVHLDTALLKAAEDVSNLLVKTLKCDLQCKSGENDLIL